MDLEGQQPESCGGRSESTALRIVQEALSNVRHHARARKVTVSLIFCPSEILLRVVDDGIGFDPDLVQSAESATLNGLGLAGMRERADVVGGVVKLHSVLGTGTTRARGY